MCFEYYKAELLDGQCAFEKCILHGANPSRPSKLFTDLNGKITAI